jgi:hypothetical protein
VVHPVGETPDRIKNNPALAGIDVGNTGTGAQAPMLVTPSMLVYAGDVSDGTPHLFAIDKDDGPSWPASGALLPAVTA